jgi:hypothetical protein
MKTAEALLAILDEGYAKKAWHGPNLVQSLKGVNAKQAAWRPGKGRHNIWELALHVAFWKHAVRRRLGEAELGSFALEGHNFFPRPEKGRANEAAWKADRAILEEEQQALRAAAAKVLRKPQPKKVLNMIYGAALHDVYHAGQIRLLRRLREGKR